MKIILTKSGDVLVNGVKRGTHGRDGDWFEAVMDVPTFPHRRYGEHGRDRRRAFRTQRRLREAIACNLQEELPA